MVRLCQNGSLGYIYIYIHVRKRTMHDGSQVTKALWLFEENALGRVSPIRVLCQRYIYTARGTETRYSRAGGAGGGAQRQTHRSHRARRTSPGVFSSSIWEVLLSLSLSLSLLSCARRWRRSRRASRRCGRRRRGTRSWKSRRLWAARHGRVAHSRTFPFSETCFRDFKG